MSLRKQIGIDYGDITPDTTQADRVQYINFKLAALGLPVYNPDGSGSSEGIYYINLFEDIIGDYTEKTRIVDLRKVGIYKRINNFFESYFSGAADMPRVVDNALTLDHYGLAREMSLPPGGNTFTNEYINSYRIKQGVLHNPKNDRRTTKGSFHIAEGGLPIPHDKKAVSKETFLKLYQAAVNPPAELMVLPFTAGQKQKAKTFVSLLMKPVVSPEVPGALKEKRMEILAIAPGSLVSNLDFLESVFGNMGDQNLHSNDLGLCPESWSGHTGYIILAPHLTKLKKKALGLPHYDSATERQRRDGMCYRDADELYNEGQSFKITCRGGSGVAVTIIADNYFGYSKKEVKTQISFAANLLGNAEEEHAGGTIVYPRRNLGVIYDGNEDKRLEGYSFGEVLKNYGGTMELREGGYAVDKKNGNVVYLPEDVKIDLYRTQISWMNNGAESRLKLLPGHVYILPNGERIHIEKHPEAPTWKLVGTSPEGTFCHKPCTVSGGGKSEISKPITDSIIYGTYYVNDLDEDLDSVERILNYDYRGRWKDDPSRMRPSRTILSSDRSLGSVIKLLTPSPAYTDEFNAFIDAIPNQVKALVFMVKRFYEPSWGGDWRKHFTVDIVNGKPGNELNFDSRKIRPSYLRVGFMPDHSWRIFKLRMDFMPSEKIHMEDDVTASVTVPGLSLGLGAERSYKFVANCEYRFFQRPDDAVIKGYDLKAEKDLSSGNLFATNFEPLRKKDVQQIKEDAIGYIKYTQPVTDLIESFLAGGDEYCVVSSEPRIVDGAPSKNPRYLEHRSDFTDPVRSYVAEVGVRLSRKIPPDQPVLMPVDAVLPGRRNNPPGVEGGKKIPPLSVYNPIHYQELPELFMDYISSLTGKSPSTTGAGSEGALTKGPFNMLLPVYDLNSALLSYILGGYSAFSTSAGFIGTDTRVDHDISILIPELWSRLSESERSPEKLIAEGSFKKVDDFEYDGKLIPAGILGYRMTDVFCYKYLGKIFDELQAVFTEEILEPEKQSMEAFADGILNIAEGHRKAALQYFADGSAEYAIPPLKALLNIMAHGNYEGKTLDSRDVRTLFEKEYVLASEWYAERLKNKQRVDVLLAERVVSNLESFTADPVNAAVVKEYRYDKKLREAKELLASYKSAQHLESLCGCLGSEPIMLE